jgi:hypothetical protein
MLKDATDGIPVPPKGAGEARSDDISFEVQVVCGRATPVEADVARTGQYPIVVTIPWHG